MKILDIIKSIIFFFVFCGFLYMITDTLISEREQRKRHFKIEFGSGRIYWADSVNIVSENEINFFDIDTKRNVKLYGQFTISTPHILFEKNN
jgi:hypothetical protein